MTAQILTQARLKEFLHYDPDTGIFTRIKTVGCVSKGSVAGWVNTHGYLQTRIDKQYYLLSRLAFLYMEGMFPAEFVDHENHKRQDNRWINLRHASRTDNSRNYTKRKDNTSGHVGVSWYPRYQQWLARISHNGKRICLGYYDTKEKAMAARRSASEEYKYHKNHGN